MAYKVLATHCALLSFKRPIAATQHMPIRALALKNLRVFFIAGSCRLKLRFGKFASELQASQTKNRSWGSYHGTVFSFNCLQPTLGCKLLRVFYYSKSNIPKRKPQALLGEFPWEDFDWPDTVKADRVIHQTKN
jgi:hypothetical protein